MVAAIQGSEILSRARRSDAEFDELMRAVDRHGPRTHIIKTLQRSAEAGYAAGYAAGFRAAQSNFREVIGLPERD